jgi:hypothetical protein
MAVTINGTTGITNPDGSASTPSIAGSDSNTGVFFPAADTVGIATGGVERLRLASDGSQSSVIPSESTLYPQFACRAWVNFLATATPISILGSGNVSSITDSGVGIYVVNLSTAMPDATYAPLAGGTAAVSEASDTFNVSVTNASSYQIRTLEAGTLRDKAVYSAIFR